MNRLDQCLRQLRGKTPRRVAAADIGISAAYLTSLEHGVRTQPGLVILRKIAKYYRVSMASLLTMAGYLDEDATPSELQILCDGWMRLDDTQRMLLMNLLQIQLKNAKPKISVRKQTPRQGTETPEYEAPAWGFPSNPWGTLNGDDVIYPFGG